MSRRDPKEWQFGQMVIEKDFATLPQVRECMAIQDRIWEIGETPKPLEAILLGKGYLTEEKAVLVRMALLEGTTRPSTKPIPDAPEPEPPPSVVPPPAPRHDTRRPARVRPSFSLASMLFAAFLLLAVMGGVYILVFTKDSGRTPGQANKNQPAEDPYGAVPKRELQKTIDWAHTDAKTFDNYWKIMDEFTRFRQKYAKTAWEDRAYEEEKQYRTLAGEYAARRLSDIRDREKAYRSQGRMQDVVKLYKSFPPQLLDATEAGLAVKSELESLRGRMAEQYQLDRMELEKLVGEGHYDQALEKISEMEGYADDAQKAKLGEKKAEVIKLKDKQSGDAGADLQTEYARLSGSLREQFRRRRYVEGIDAITGFLKKPAAAAARLLPSGLDAARLIAALEHHDLGVAWSMLHPAMKSMDASASPSMDLQHLVLYDLSNALLLGMLLEDVRQAIHLAASGKEIFSLNTLHGESGTFQEDKGLISFTSAAHPGVAIRIEEILAEEDIEQLAIRSLDPDRAKCAGKFLGDAVMQARIGLMYYHSGQAAHIPRAHACLKKAMALGEPWLGLYLPPLERLLESQKEVVFRQKLETAQKSIDKREFTEAKRVLAELQAESAGSSWARDHGQEVVQMVQRIEELVTVEDTQREKIKQLEKDCRCRIEPVAKNTFRYVYDFSGPQQLEAFEPLKDKKGQWLIIQGELWGNSSPALMWKKKIAGDVTLEFKLVMMENQNFLVNLFYHTKEDRYYAFALGLDLIAGDMEQKMGLPVNAVVKYPMPLNWADFKKPEFWEGIKKRIISTQARPTALSRYVPYAVRIERTGARLRLLVDGNVLCEGEDPDYTEGYLVFSLSDSKIHLDDLKITVVER